jgi:hypothetical protein
MNTTYMIKQELALLSAQRLDNKPIYSMKDDFVPSTFKSKRTAYRYRKYLESIGILKGKRGNFKLNTSVISQLHLIQKLLPSIKSLKNARRFGRHYNEKDIEFFRKHIEYQLITLDYKVWELTKYQNPSDLYVYVKDIDKVANYLKGKKFKEGKKGRITLLPMIGDFSNEIQRVYLDCIAKGGRNTQDAIAINLLYWDHITSKGRFNIEEVKNVQDNLKLIDKPQQQSNKVSV